MGTGWFLTPGVGGVNNVNINNRQVKNRPFFGNAKTDSFEFTTVSRYTNEMAIRHLMAANPKVAQIMKEIGADGTLNMSDVQQNLMGHLNETKNVAVGITNKLPIALKNQVNTQEVADAAYLHDLGKVLIPREILNKPGKLNESERKIIDRHAEIGYELLKTTGLSPNTLKLIKDHHKVSANSDIALQIVAMADEYSALLEDRMYKEAMDPKQVLTIIYSEVKAGKFHPFVFRSLVDYVNAQQTQEVIV